jgi:hypothetical protein
MDVNGEDAKLNYKVGGCAAAGEWLELSNLKTNKVSCPRGKADATTRASGKVKQYRPGHIDFSIEGEMQWDTEDAGFTALREAWADGVAIGIQCLDREDGEGPELDCMVEEFSRNEPLGEPQTVSIKLCPIRSNYPWTWVTPT